jgi:hypothetical protein
MGRLLKPLLQLRVISPLLCRTGNSSGPYWEVFERPRVLGHPPHTVLRSLSWDPMGWASPRSLQISQIHSQTLPVFGRYIWDWVTLDCPVWLACPYPARSLL